jgi:hypothetical protein
LKQYSVYIYGISHFQVCICEDSLCNTFAFLRSQIDGNNHEEGLHFANGNGGVGSSSGGAVQRSLYQPLDSQVPWHLFSRDLSI